MSEEGERVSLSAQRMGKGLREPAAVLCHSRGPAAKQRHSSRRERGSPSTLNPQRLPGSRIRIPVIALLSVAG